MTLPLVGFYVHYHGLGHKHRTEAILQHLTLPATVLTSRIHDLSWQGPTLQEVIGLDCDIDDVPEEGLSRAQDVSALHYAPLWTNGCTRRIAQFADWVDRRRPALMVVDVSAEISLLTRLCSVPQLVMRQHGIRTDPAHTAAYEAAEALLAPFPEIMEDDQTPDWIRERTIYLDGFARSSSAVSRSDARQQLKIESDRQIVVAMFGRGGDGVPLHHLIDAARQCEHYEWYAIGQTADCKCALPSNLHIVGWTDQPQLWLSVADCVVTAAGHNSVMEVGRQRRPFIAIAEDRPFQEQHRKAAVLDRQGLAIGLHNWPDGEVWPTLLRRAERLDVSRWDAIYQQDGAAQAADCIRHFATDSDEVRRATGARKDISHA